MEEINGNTLIGMVQAYHGRVYSKETLKKLSNERLMSMIHPSDREYLADQTKLLEK